MKKIILLSIVLCLTALGMACNGNSNEKLVNALNNMNNANGSANNANRPANNTATNTTAPANNTNATPVSGDESENAEVFAHVWELLAAQSAERDILVAADTALQVRAAERVGAQITSASA